MRRFSTRRSRSTSFQRKSSANRASSSLQEALKNVPGITLNAGEGGTHGDLVNLRGFSAGDDYFLDGLRDTGLYDRDSFNVEAIEVYKGPGVDPLRARLDGRRHQSGEQDAACRRRGEHARHLWHQ